MRLQLRLLDPPGVRPIQELGPCGAEHRSLAVSTIVAARMKEKLGVQKAPLGPFLVTPRGQSELEPLQRHWASVGRQDLLQLLSARGHLGPLQHQHEEHLSAADVVDRHHGLRVDLSLGKGVMNIDIEPYPIRIWIGDGRGPTAKTGRAVRMIVVRDDKPVSVKVLTRVERSELRTLSPEGPHSLCDGLQRLARTFHDVILFCHAG